MMTSDTLSDIMSMLLKDLKSTRSIACRGLALSHRCICASHNLQGALFHMLRPVLAPLNDRTTPVQSATLNSKTTYCRHATHLHASQMAEAKKLIFRLQASQFDAEIRGAPHTPNMCHITKKSHDVDLMHALYPFMGH